MDLGRRGGWVFGERGEGLVVVIFVHWILSSFGESYFVVASFRLKVSVNNIYLEFVAFFNLN